MTPTNRLDSVPPNVLRGASIPNALAGVAAQMPPGPALALPIAAAGLIAAMLALLVALLVPLLPGRVP